jgi:hypothetical protein
MVRKLALSGLAALLLAGSGCTQNRGLSGIDKVEIATDSGPEHKDLSYISKKIPSSWETHLSDYTYGMYKAVLSRERLGAIVGVNRFEDEEAAIKYLSEKLRGRKVDVEKDRIELSYKIRDGKIGDVVFPKTMEHYDLITRSKNLVFEVGSLSPSRKEKRELRELLYSLVKQL